MESHHDRSAGATWGTAGDLDRVEDLYLAADAD
jgi:hypothetical protein